VTARQEHETGERDAKTYEAAGSTVGLARLARLALAYLRAGGGRAQRVSVFASRGRGRKGCDEEQRGGESHHEVRRRVRPIPLVWAILPKPR
jgi:hypothetical protein